MLTAPDELPLLDWLLLGSFRWFAVTVGSAVESEAVAVAAEVAAAI